MTIWHKKVFTIDNLMHFAGAGLMAMVLYAGAAHPAGSTAAVFVVFSVWGLLREQAQGGFPITHFNLGAHKWLEALSWGVGGATITLILEIWGWR